MKRRKEKLEEEEKINLFKFKIEEIDLTIENRLKVNFNGYHFFIYPQGNDIVIMKVGPLSSSTMYITPASGNVILLR